MPDQRQAERDLDRLWDQVARGGPADEPQGLDRDQAETIRRFQALAQAPAPATARAHAWRRLRAQFDPKIERPRATDQKAVLPPSRSPIGPNGRVEPATATRRWPTAPLPHRVRRWSVPQVAAAVLLLIAVLALAVVFRPGDDEDIRIVAPTDPTTEVLAEVAVDGLTADGLLYIHRWSLRSGAAASDDSDGVTFGSVEQGRLGVRIGDEPERVLGPGATFVVAPGATYAIRDLGLEQGVYREVRITDEHWSEYALFEPVQALAEGLGDHTLAGLATTGPAEVALVRLTLDPGDVLDGSAEGAYYQAIIVEAGALGVDYLQNDDQLDPGEAPEYEQTSQVGPGEAPEGVDDRYREARRVVGNAGDEPLVLLAVRITPATAPGMSVVDLGSR
jgi:hypothetical protein